MTEVVAVRVLGAVLLLLVTACSSGGSGAPEAGATRAVTGIDGVVTQVPVAPKRIITLSEPTLDGALALGVRPIGTTKGRGQSSASGYLTEQAAGIPLVASIGQPDFEAIAEAAPDLILVDGTSINNNKPFLDLLRKTAPTVYTGYAGGDWRVTFRYLAQALNREADGERVIADYDQHVRTVTAEIGDRSKETFSIVRWQGNAPAVILKELLPGVALTDLGLRRPPAQDRKGRGHSEPISLELLSEIDADWMFFGTLGGSSVGNPTAGGGTALGDARAALAQAEAAPGFTLLKAYKAQHVVPVDGSVWTSTGGPLLMNRIVDDVDAALSPSPS